MPAPTSGRIEAINGLRAVAIAGVVYHHLYWGITYPGFVSFGDGRGVELRPLAVLSNGWLGVNLFFVLSGFVLYASFGRLEASSASSDWLGVVGRFYARRAVRLLPLYYLVLFVLVLLRTGRDPLSASFLEEALLLSTFTFVFSERHFMPEQNYVLWSLGVEVWASVALPWLLLVARRVGFERVLAATLVLCLVVRFLSCIDGPSPTNLYLGYVKDGVFGRLDDFMVGAWVARRIETQRVAPGGGRPRALLALGLVVFAGACWLWDELWLKEVPYLLAAVANNVVQLAIALCLFGLLGGGGLATRALSVRPLQVIGMMCYSIYVWHAPALGALVPSHRDLPHVAFYLGAVLSLSALTYAFVEFPRHDARRLFLLGGGGSPRG